MASLKELKGRINSVKSTQKITKAMKMVAAAKLRRAQDAAQNGRPYAERLEAVMAGMAARVGGDDCQRDGRRSPEQLRADAVALRELGRRHAWRYHRLPLRG